MSQLQLEQTLKDLPRRGTLVKDRGYRQVWRFEHDGRPYILKFYPRAGGRLKRLVRGNPAMREFVGLQAMQKAGVPSPRAVAMLSGFRFDGTLGDAVILDAIEPSRQLDLHLNDLLLRGEPVPNHRNIARQIREIVHGLAKVGLGHDDLHLGNFLIDPAGKASLLDGYAVRAGGLKPDHILLLGHSVSRFATTADLLRGWDVLTTGGPMPQTNHVSRALWRKLVDQAKGDNRYFGALRGDDGWRGVFFKHAKFPRRWAPASRLDVTRDQWADAWAALWRQVETDQLEVLKRSASGDVLAGEVALGGRPVRVIVKRPRRKYWHRYVTEVGRGARPRRAWFKAWQLVARDVPTAWPLLLMERRVLGYVVDTLIVYERVEGELLAQANLDTMRPHDRDTLFRRLGRALRRLEETGLAQVDAKSSNWLIVDDERRGPVPVAIDVDGIRRYWGAPDAIRRLLRSMKDHPQYTVADSLALCQGYAPRASVPREQQEPGPDASPLPPSPMGEGGGEGAREVRDASSADAALREDASDAGRAERVGTRSTTEQAPRLR